MTTSAGNACLICDAVEVRDVPLFLDPGGVARESFVALCLGCVNFLTRAPTPIQWPELASVALWVRCLYPDRFLGGPGPRHADSLELSDNEFRGALLHPSWLRRLPVRPNSPVKLYLEVKSGAQHGWSVLRLVRHPKGLKTVASATFSRRAGLEDLHLQAMIGAMLYGLAEAAELPASAPISIRSTHELLGRLLDPDTDAATPDSEPPTALARYLAGQLSDLDHPVRVVHQLPPVGLRRR